MSIEEATEILNSAVITEPSIKSYTYISAEEINLAIQRLMIELEKNQQEIKNLKKEKNNVRKQKVYTSKNTYLCYRV